ncbi:MAG: radical SAM protein [Candidatus Gracilibacteria bacterium]|nr:radical SAM protein [Candidatus Gracilibacteria bacterium]
MKTIRLENTSYPKMDNKKRNKILVGDDATGYIKAISIPEVEINESEDLEILIDRIKLLLGNILDFGNIGNYRIINNSPIEGGYSAPFKIYLDLSDKCQLSCKFCLSSSSIEGTNELNIEQLKRIIQEMGELGVFRVKLGGGEPLIYPYIFDVIKLLRDNHIFVSLSTNGKKMNRKIAQLLKLYGVKVSVSMDGNLENNDYLRGKGTYKQAINAIKILKEEGVVNLSIRMNIIPVNFEDISHIVVLAKSLGIKAKFCFCRPSGRASIDSSMLVGFDNSKYYYEVLKYLNSPEILPFVSIDESMMFEQPEELKTYIWGEQICGAANRSMHIDSSGKISPCVYMGKSYQQGKIYEDGSLINFWRGEIGNAFAKMRNLQEPEGCKTCDRLCKFECPANRSHFNGGDTTGPDPVCLKYITNNL